MIEGFVSGKVYLEPKNRFCVLCVGQNKTPQSRQLNFIGKGTTLYAWLDGGGITSRLHVEITPKLSRAMKLTDNDVLVATIKAEVGRACLLREDFAPFILAVDEGKKPDSIWSVGFRRFAPPYIPNNFRALSVGDEHISNRFFLTSFHFIRTQLKIGEKVFLIGAPSLNINGSFDNVERKLGGGLTFDFLFNYQKASLNVPIIVSEEYSPARDGTYITNIKDEDVFGDETSLFKGITFLATGSPNYTLGFGDGESSKILRMGAYGSDLWNPARFIIREDVTTLYFSHKSE